MMASSSKRGNKHIALRVLAVGFSIGLAAFVILQRDVILQYSAYGYLGVFVISVLGNATLLLPAPAFTVVAAGAVLNPYIVGVLAGIGAGLGEMTGYFLGLGLSPEAASRETENVDESEPLQRRRWFFWLRERIERQGVIAIFLLAAVPNPIFDVGGIIAGTLRMSWWKFLSAAILGKTVRFMILSIAFGAAFGWIR